MSEKSDDILDRRGVDEAINDTVGRAFAILNENMNKKFAEEFAKLKEDLGASATTSKSPGKRPADGNGGKAAQKKQKPANAATDDAQKGKKRETFIPKKEWLARKAAKRCLRCGQEGHHAAECKNEKTAESFQKGV